MKKFFLKKKKFVCLGSNTKVDMIFFSRLNLPENSTKKRKEVKFR